MLSCFAADRKLTSVPRTTSETVINFSRVGWNWLRLYHWSRTPALHPYFQRWPSGWASSTTAFRLGYSHLCLNQELAQVLCLPPWQAWISLQNVPTFCQLAVAVSSLHPAFLPPLQLIFCIDDKNCQQDIWHGIHLHILNRAKNWNMLKG